MSLLTATLFGPPTIFSAGDAVGGLRHKSTALFAYLAVEGRPVGRDTLATLFWPRSGQTQARANLRSCIFQLNEILGTSLVNNGSDLLKLDLERCRVDVVEFRKRVAEARSAADDSLREKRLTEAESLFTAPFLEGFTLPDCPDFDTWEFLHEELFRRQLSSVLYDLIEFASLRSNWTDSLRLGRRLIALDPLEEGSHRLVMRLLARSGQRSAAIEQYRECRRFLAEELDEEPELQTEELLQEISSGLSSDIFIPSPSVPQLANSFFGRQQELQSIREIFSSGGRLCTLTGPAGAGKTRLAIEGCRSAAALFPGGLIFIELSRINCPDELPAVISAACGLRESFSSAEEAIGLLVRYFSGSKILLVLDNFEHLVECRDFIDALLNRSSSLSLLVSSREGLQIGHERILEVHPFDVSGDEAADASALFLDRARLILEAEELETIPLDKIVDICSLLDGLPLAIELAVPLLKVFTIEELRKSLTQPLKILRSGINDSASRHSSLQKAISSSVSLLSREEARLFSALSVFAGGFSLTAAAEICGDAGSEAGCPVLLRSLIQKSLVRENGRLRSGEKRFFLLESIRQYARLQIEAIDTFAEILRRFVDYYRNMVADLSSLFDGPRESEAVHLLELDDANLRQLLQTLYSDAQYSEGVRICIDLHWFWYRRGYFVLGERWLAAFLEALPSDQIRLRAAGIASRAWLLFVGGQWRRAQELYAESLYLSRETGDAATEARALSGVGVSLRWMGDTVRGEEYALQAVDAARQTGDRPLIIFTLIWAYATTGGESDDNTAVAELERAAELSRASGNQWYYAHALNGLGDIRSARGEFDRALADYQISLQLFQDLGDRWMCAWCEEGMGLAALRQHRYVEAARRSAEALRLFAEVGDRMNVAVLLVRMADLALHLSRRETAARYAGGASLILDSVRDTDEGRSPRLTRARERCREYEIDYPQYWAAGRAMRIDELLEGDVWSESEA